MAITTTSVTGDTIATILSAARHTEQHQTVMRHLAWKIRKPKHGGSTVNLPIWGTATAYALTEGVDMANPQSLTDTKVTITPAEVGCQIILTDKVVHDNNEDVLAAGGRVLGNAMGKKEDQDLLEQLDDASRSLGSNSTTMTLGHLAASYGLLAGNTGTHGPCPKPYVAVHHPYTLVDLVDVFTPIVPATNTYSGSVGSVGDLVLRNYHVGRLFDMDVYSAGNLQNQGSDDAKGGVFGKGNSVILVTAEEWDVEQERDASLRATELNCVGYYGVGEYLNQWIVELHMDMTDPA